MASDLDRILERLVVDSAFVDLFRRDPARALDGYDVDDGDLDVLQASVAGDPGSLGAVEERQNKATLMGLASGIAEAMGSGHGVAGGPLHAPPHGTAALPHVATALPHGDDGVAEHLMEMQHMLGGVTHQHEMLAHDMLAHDSVAPIGGHLGGPGPDDLPVVHHPLVDGGFDAGDAAGDTGGDSGGIFDDLFDLDG